MAQRGTSNSNQRGNTVDRYRRQLWMLDAWQANKGHGLVRCYRCGKLLNLLNMTIDRIIPGCKGGTYRHNNIRPACARCNSETGGGLRA